MKRRELLRGITLAPLAIVSGALTAVAALPNGTGSGWKVYATADRFIAAHPDHESIDITDRFFTTEGTQVV